MWPRSTSPFNPEFIWSMTFTKTQTKFVRNLIKTTRYRHYMTFMDGVRTVHNLHSIHPQRWPVSKATWRTLVRRWPVSKATWKTLMWLTLSRGRGCSVQRGATVLSSAPDWDDGMNHPAFPRNESLWHTHTHTQHTRYRPHSIYPTTPKSFPNSNTFIANWPSQTVLFESVTNNNQQRKKQKTQTFSPPGGEPYPSHTKLGQTWSQSWGPEAGWTPAHNDRKTKAHS